MPSCLEYLVWWHTMARASTVRVRDTATAQAADTRHGRHVGARGRSRSAHVSSMRKIKLVLGDDLLIVPSRRNARGIVH